MKKNKMMRLASVLLIAVMLTTSVISGTFAKYVTEDGTEDHARVAKFGVVVAASGHLFDQNYYAADDNTGVAGFKEGQQDKKDILSLTVETSNGDKLVAPGTESEEGMTFAITGTPEVDVRINIEIDEETMRDVFLSAAATLPDMTNTKPGATFEIDEDYYPLVFTLSGDLVENQWAAIKDFVDGEEGMTVDKKVSVSGTMAQIVDLLTTVFEGEDGEGIYVDANTALEEVFGSFTLNWKWAYEGVQTLNGTKYNAKQVDKADTLLGDLAARDFGDFEYEVLKKNGDPTAKTEAFNELAADEADWEAGDYNLTVALKMTVRVTQVD